LTILITGSTGALGSELAMIFPDSLSPTHKDFDICDLSSVQKFFCSKKIDIVIHTAALTSVRGCEENKSKALDINVKGTRNLITEFKKSNPSGKFVYISTACVFDGDSGMFTETSIPYPENFYSLTKLLGENIVSHFNNSLIIRTNFIAKKQWPYPKAFTDRYGTYLFANQIALGIKDILNENLEGIIHLAGDKKISMFELAKLTSPDIQPMTMNDYSGPPLTIDMSLDSKRWKKYNIDN